MCYRKTRQNYALLVREKAYNKLNGIMEIYRFYIYNVLSVGNRPHSGAAARRARALPITENIYLYSCTTCNESCMSRKTVKQKLKIYRYSLNNN